MHVYHRHVKMEPHVEQMVMDIVAHVEHSIRVLIVKHVNKYRLNLPWPTCESYFEVEFLLIK